MPVLRGYETYNPHRPFADFPCFLSNSCGFSNARREAQEEGQYAEAFWLCAQCIKSMDELGEGLQVATQARSFLSFLPSGGRLASAVGHTIQCSHQQEGTG